MSLVRLRDLTDDDLDLLFVWEQDPRGREMAAFPGRPARPRGVRRAPPPHP